MERNFRPRAALSAVPNAVTAGIRRPKPSPSRRPYRTRRRPHRRRKQRPARRRFATGPAPDPVPEPVAASPTRAYAPAAGAEQPRTPLGPKLAVVAGWIGLIVVVLLIGASAVRYRQDIAVIWPQSAGVYSSLGLKVNASGIDFQAVTYKRDTEDGQTVLSVSGTIVNTGSRELPVPQTVRVTLSDAGNRELYHWTFKPNATVLKAGPVGALHHPAFQPARRGGSSGSALRQRRRLMAPDVLFTAEQIQARVRSLAAEIAAAPRRPDIAMPVLVGGFVFAADLIRALAWEGVPLDVEMIWLGPMATSGSPAPFP